jgi:hypothetical protein
VPSLSFFTDENVWSVTSYRTHVNTRRRVWWRALTVQANMGCSGASDDPRTLVVNGRSCTCCLSHHLHAHILRQHCISYNVLVLCRVWRRPSTRPGVCPRYRQPCGYAARTDALGEVTLRRSDVWQAQPGARYGNSSVKSFMLVRHSLVQDICATLGTRSKMQAYVNCTLLCVFLISPALIIESLHLLFPGNQISLRNQRLIR